MPTNEAGVVDAICRAIKREYPHAWQFKVVGSPWQMSGVPDLLFCVSGLLVGLEVKYQRRGETRAVARQKAEPIQRVQLRRIARAGGIAAVVLSKEEALAMIARALREKR